MHKIDTWTQAEKGHLLNSREFTGQAIDEIYNIYIYTFIWDCCFCFGRCEFHSSIVPGSDQGTGSMLRNGLGVEIQKEDRPQKGMWRAISKWRLWASSGSSFDPTGWCQQIWKCWFQHVSTIWPQLLWTRKRPNGLRRRLSVAIQKHNTTLERCGSTGPCAIVPNDLKMFEGCCQKPNVPLILSNSLPHTIHISIHHHLCTINGAMKNKRRGKEKSSTSWDLTDIWAVCAETRVSYWCTG